MYVYVTVSSSYYFHTVISIWLQHDWILPKEPTNVKSYTQTRFHNWNTMSYDFHDKLSHELFHFEQTVVFDMAFRQAKVQTLRCYSWCTCAAIVIWYYNCLYYYKKYIKKYKKKCHVLFCSLKTLLSFFRQSQHNRSSYFFPQTWPWHYYPGWMPREVSGSRFCAV